LEKLIGDSSSDDGGQPWLEMSKGELNLIINNDALTKEVSDQKTSDKLPTKIREKSMT
jgi:hypothetical protein